MPGFSVVTFGCQMNQHDSERIGEALRAAGWFEEPDLEATDLVVLNTCSVREKAEQKLRSEVGRLALLKERRPGLLIGVAGCLAQQEGERLVARMPVIDLVVGPDNLAEIPALAAGTKETSSARVKTEFDLEAPRFLPAEPVPGRQGPTAYVTVMKGCNERCSFCIVPTTRGPERYRASGEITAEITRLVEAGAREVTLLGQTVNSYRDPSRALEPVLRASFRSWSHTHPTTAREDESEFPALLRAIAASVPRLGRLRYTSPHPRHLTRSLIRAHRELAPLARHVHLPVQSGSDQVLKRMIRRYSVAEYEERVGALRDEVPGVTLSTDVIVGFPGETEHDFERTLALVARLGFTGLFGFKYSPRPGTPALSLASEPSEAVKSERLSRLFELGDRLRRSHLEALVGSRQSVLVEGRGRDDAFGGRTEQNEIVHFRSQLELTGEFVPVLVRRAFKNSLGAELDSAWLEAARERQGAPVSSAPERRSLPIAP